MECHLWGELVRSESISDSMLFPRLLSMSERAWHKASWEDEPEKETRNGKQAADFSQFASFLGHKELLFLDRMKVNYWIPPPGAR